VVVPVLLARRRVRRRTAVPAPVAIPVMLPFVTFGMLPPYRRA
jgi:hypothetical protein